MIGKPRPFWRGGRVVECGSLENCFVARQRGFESLPLRCQQKKEVEQFTTSSQTVNVKINIEGLETADFYRG